MGKESVNFNITLLIYSIALSLLGVVGVLLVAVFFVGLFILIPVGIASLALLVFWIVVVIQAAKAAREGQPYEYPITFRFIR